MTDSAGDPKAIERHATSRGEDGSSETRALAAWRDEPAYVLLGDPGAGKSWSLVEEAEAAGEKVIPARLVQEDLEPPASSDRTVFIDGLDEVRGTATSGVDALGSIARWLLRSGSPRFRIACREADWRGQADLQLIVRAAPGGRVTSLHLDPLTEGEIFQILRQHADEAGEPKGFLSAAERHGIADLLGNPLLLQLLIGAISADGGKWPETRFEVYDGACRDLANEASLVHRARVALEAGYTDRLLDDAGLLFAVLLLSGSRAICWQGQSHPGDISLPSLPSELRFSDPSAALRSKLFSIEDGTTVPRHRTVAEFLAAKAISRRIRENGLPLGRVLALVQGFDGKPVEALRGLFGWLAVHLVGADRSALLRLDPVAVVLNGDAAALNRPERLLTLESLAASAADNKWFRTGQWVNHPFGPLATGDMVGEYMAVLSDVHRDETHQVFVDCVLDALLHAPESMPSICESLASWVADSTAFDWVRLSALDAWRRHCPEESRSAQLLSWLEGIHDESFQDADDRLLGRILREAYPTSIQAEVLRFLRPKKNRQLIAEFSDFWSRHFVERTSPADLPHVANAWVARFPNGLPHEEGLDAQRAADALLAATLKTWGDTATPETLHFWLRIGLDQYGTEHGSAEHRQWLSRWLGDRPALMKQVARVAYKSHAHDGPPKSHLWQSESCLRGAELPADWLRWNLELAADSPDEHFVKWVTSRVAWALINPPQHLCIPTLEELERWADSRSDQFPDAKDWLSQALTSPLEDWRADEHRRRKERCSERAQERTTRREQFAPYLAKISSSPLPAVWLEYVANAHEKRYSDIEGETPEARIQDLLGASEGTVNLVLASLDATLDRSDLPSPQEILELDSIEQRHLVRPAVLLAAHRVYERGPAVVRSWRDDLISTLVAFRLTEGTGEDPMWYRQVATDRPELVAPLLVQYATARLKRKEPQSVCGLRRLARDGGRLSELALPGILERFPSRARDSARHELNHSLLAALPALGTERARDIVHAKLRSACMDPNQRIAWLVALLPYEPSALEELERLTRMRPRRAAALGQALREQGTLSREGPRLGPSVLHGLVMLLAPITRHDPRWSGGFVDEERQREGIVKHLLQYLGSIPTIEARNALKNLEASGQLGEWRAVAEFQVQAQRSLYREATFALASSTAVAMVLANRAPASPADLSALLLDHLRAVEVHVRGDPSFQLRQFWRQDKAIPQHEEWCRDALLDQLRPRLLANMVDIQPEAAAAARKRMDLRATALPTSGSRITLPVEAKKDSHDELWTAWRDQLQSLYVIDPDARGFGIYLVLWFDYETTLSPEGTRASSPEELRKLIQERIPAADRHRLCVHVIDLSWPSQAKPPSRSNRSKGKATKP